MSFEEIRQALDGHMVAWNDAPTAFDNLPTPPAVRDAHSSRSPWCAFFILHGTSDLATFQDAVRRPGVAIVQVFTAPGVGDAPMTRIATSLASHFEGFTAGALRCRAASVDRVGVANGWRQVNVMIPWEVMP